MRSTIRLAPLMLALLVLVSAIGGCGKKETPSGETSPTGGAKEINVGIAQDIDDSLDPHKMVAAGTREVLFNVFEGLVKPASDGNLAPAVASGYEISESGGTFTFTLREDVRFHNGQAVTAEDVIYSISRCAGLDGGERLVPAFSIITSITAPDEKTVVIETSETNIELLAYLTAAIIPKDYDAQATQPVGTGPFKYVSRSPQENIVLEKFGEYWGDAVKLDRVTFKIIDNAETMIMSLKSGALDLCANLTVSQMKELEGGNLNFEIGTMNLVQAVYLNNAVAPLDEYNVRHALSYAINRTEIMEFLSDGLGEAVGSSMYPSFEKYFVPELVDYYEYNPTLAKQLLIGAGYPDGFDLEITVPSNHQPHIDTATIVVEQLRAIGVNATIKQVEWATWLSDVYTGRDFQATIVGVDASAMTARAMLERFCGSSGKNFINFSDDEYDEVFGAAISATDDEAQTQLYKRLQEILTEKAANLYIQDLCDVVAVSDKLDGFEFYPIFVLDLSKLHFAG